MLGRISEALNEVWAMMSWRPRARPWQALVHVLFGKIARLPMPSSRGRGASACSGRTRGYGRDIRGSSWKHGKQMTSNLGRKQGPVPFIGTCSPAWNRGFTAVAVKASTTFRPNQPASTYFSSGHGRYLVSASLLCSTFMMGEAGLEADEIVRHLPVQVRADFGDRDLKSFRIDVCPSQTAPTVPIVISILPRLLLKIPSFQPPEPARLYRAPGGCVTEGWASASQASLRDRCAAPAPGFVAR